MSFKGAKSMLNSAASAGASAHFAKMKKQASQLKGEGATTGGLATSAGAPKISNKAGKFYSKGKN